MHISKQSVASRRAFITKTLLGSAAVAAGGAGLTTLSGCKYPPTPATIHAVALPVGYSAGLVCNECEIDDKTRAVVIEIVGLVQNAIPSADQSFYDKWMPLAEQHVADLVAAGTITKVQGDLALAAFALVCRAVDWLFTEKYPKAREYTNLVLAGVDGFVVGFLTTFKPANGIDGSDCPDCQIKELRLNAYNVRATAFYAHADAKALEVFHANFKAWQARPAR